jgi:hypothetical protein
VRQRVVLQSPAREPSPVYLAGRVSTPADPSIYPGRGSSLVRSKEWTQGARVLHHLTWRIWFPAAPVEGGRASPPHRPREGGLAHPADTSRSNLADALGLLSRWDGFPNSKPCFPRETMARTRALEVCAHRKKCLVQGFGFQPVGLRFPAAPVESSRERGHPTGRERMSSLTTQTLQDPILLPPWVCFRGGFPNPKRCPS